MPQNLYFTQFRDGVFYREQFVIAKDKKEAKHSLKVEYGDFITFIDITKVNIEAPRLLRMLTFESANESKIQARIKKQKDDRFVPKKVKIKKIKSKGILDDYWAYGQ